MFITNQLATIMNKYLSEIYKSYSEEEWAKALEGIFNAGEGSKVVEQREFTKPRQSKEGVYVDNNNAEYVNAVEKKLKGAGEKHDRAFLETEFGFGQAKETERGKPPQLNNELDKLKYDINILLNNYYIKTSVDTALCKNKKYYKKRAEIAEDCINAINNLRSEAWDTLT
jgi:hypothetical protein